MMEWIKLCRLSSFYLQRREGTIRHKVSWQPSHTVSQSHLEIYIYNSCEYGLYCKKFRYIQKQGGRHERSPVSGNGSAIPV